MAAGTIDEAFIDYVYEENSDLYNYFAAHDQDERDAIPPEHEGDKVHNFYYTAPNGDEIDIPHFAATYNVLQYDSLGEFADLLVEPRADALGGWAGDLRSLIPRVLCDVNYSNDYDTVYNKAKGQIGADETISLFGIQDILADTDAYNVYNLTQINDDSIGGALIDFYYLGGDLTRFSDFTQNRNRDEIYNWNRDMMTDLSVGIVWPIKKVIKNGSKYDDTEETLTITDTQMNAICAAYADYIWEKVQAE